MNAIIWKGVLSTTIKGLLICELPPITKPQMRTKETVIDGRDGSIIEELGYSSYDKVVSIGLHGDFDINEIIKYFTGEGEIVFSNEPDKVYRAKISAQIDYNRLLRYRQANIPFKIQPFKYAYNEDLSITEKATASGTYVHIKDMYKVTSLNVDGGSETIKAVGKNLFDYKTHLIKNGSGLTNTLNDDGSITSSGVANVNYAQVVYFDLTKVLMNGHTYTMSQKYISSKLFMQLTIINNTTGERTYLYLSKKLKETFVADTENNTYSLTVQTSTMDIYGKENLTTTNFYQVEEGSVATDFEPFATNSYAYEEGGSVDGMVVYSPDTLLYNANGKNMTVDYIKPFNVFNKGLETSKPKMTLEGTGTVEISVNGLGVFSYEFPEGETKVIIDSEIEDAYLDGTLKNRNMNGEFPVLQPGTNTIEWTGNVTNIEIEPRSRWL